MTNEMELERVLCPHYFGTGGCALITNVLSLKEREEGCRLVKLYHQSGDVRVLDPINCELNLLYDLVN